MFDPYTEVPEVRAMVLRLKHEARSRCGGVALDRAILVELRQLAKEGEAELPESLRSKLPTA